MKTSRERNAADGSMAGSWFALGAYSLWGLLPLYWKILKAFPAGEVLAHRVLWSFAFYLALALYRKTSSLPALLRQTRLFAPIALAAALIGGNWLLYIYAVNSGHVLESSLGYFITPILNIVTGAAVLREKLSRLRWTAVLLGFAAVLILAVQAEHFPWIAIGLSSSFAVYGLIRKRLPSDVLATSTLETGVLLGPALAALVYYRAAAPETVPVSAAEALLFLVSGPLTGLPLLWFAEAARRLPLSTLGFFQYLAPTLQFLLAVLVFKEPFTAAKAQAFACIWLALAMAAWDARRRR